MGLLVGEDRHRHVFGDRVVRTVSGLDQRSIKLDSGLFGLEDALDDRLDVGRVFGRLETVLVGLERLRARRGLVELF